jgi:aspartate/glutamate racemase
MVYREYYYSLNEILQEYYQQKYYQQIIFTNIDISIYVGAGLGMTEL